MQVLSQWVDGFKIDKVDMVGTVTVRFLLRPMVEWLVTHNQTGALTPEVINSLVVNIFCTVSNEASECDDMFQSEVIRLCVILVQHVPYLIRDHKKQIIQYIWYVGTRSLIIVHGLDLTIVVGIQVDSQKG